MTAIAIRRPDDDPSIMRWGAHELVHRDALRDSLRRVRVDYRRRAACPFLQPEARAFYLRAVESIGAWLEELRAASVAAPTEVAP